MLEKHLSCFWRQKARFLLKIKRVHTGASPQTCLKSDSIYYQGGIFSLAGQKICHEIDCSDFDRLGLVKSQ